MIEKVQLKGGICELNFGYTAKTVVYTNSSSDITKLYTISGVIQMSNLKSIYRGGFKCGICGLFS